MFEKLFYRNMHGYICMFMSLCTYIIYICIYVCARNCVFLIVCVYKRVGVLENRLQNYPPTVMVILKQRI